ncbi:MAG: hypothetical protein HOP03_15700 [Lysobacter sp.]|nr:hypothetical protein [Lysobacter sp.]
MKRISVGEDFLSGSLRPCAFFGSALQHGNVYQDDEDFWNLNFWIGSPDTVMGGGSNTWRALAKVK